MSRFNSVVKRMVPTTVNVAGGKAFSESDKLEFISILLTSFLNDKFYESSNDTKSRLLSLISKISDKKFLAKASIYARTKFGMRTVSHVVAGEIAKAVKGEEWTKRYFDKIVYRVDDITEILAYFLSCYGKPIPNSLKKGLGLALGRFDSYAIAKYKGENHKVTLVDVINLIHPKPTEKNGFAIGDLVNGTLKLKDTWESKLSEAGQKAETEEELSELKLDAWKDLILNKKIKYFALLRNLSNILEQAPELVDEVCNQLCNEDVIKKSLVLPFRFNIAYKLIDSKFDDKNSRKVLQALDKALDISCNNVPKFNGDTLVVLDESGSMTGKPSEIGSLFSAVLLKANNADFVKFASSAKYSKVNYSDSVLSITNNLLDNFNGGGTNFPFIFTSLKRKYDRIIILSDMQGWMEDGAPSFEFNKYKQAFNCNPYIYSFNLNDYGSLMFPEEKVFCIGGWSEKIFDLMSLMEKGKNTLISEVEKIEL